jgi:hypothetical protein
MCVCVWKYFGKEYDATGAGSSVVVELKCASLSLFWDYSKMILFSEKRIMSDLQTPLYQACTI